MLDEGQQMLEKAMDQLVRHQYAASIENNLAVLNTYPPALADQALFQIGICYALPGNPQQDYRKSLGSFNKVISEFPASRRKVQSQLWVRFIQDASDKTKEIAALKKANVSLGNAVIQQKIDIKVLQKKIDATRDTDLVMSLEKIIDGQKKEIEQLLEQIEKLKRVDLGIEEKKQKILLQDENIEEIENGKDSGS